MQSHNCLSLQSSNINGNKIKRSHKNQIQLFSLLDKKKCLGNENVANFDIKKCCDFHYIGIRKIIKMWRPHLNMWEKRRGRNSLRENANRYIDSVII